MVFLYTSLAYSTKVFKPQVYLKYNKIRPVFSELYGIDKNNKEFNLEHIVPQSVFNKSSTIRCDMHNMILYPSKLNLHRSNYKFTSNPNIFPNSKILSEEGFPLEYISPINSENSIKTSKQRKFHPADKYKGTIARSIMYFVSAYPKYERKIFEDIISPYTLLTWHHQFPVEEFEIVKNVIIQKTQKNNNIYVLSPEELVKDMENIIKEDLSIYKKFDYTKKID